jgi:hypothetical protein
MSMNIVHTFIRNILQNSKLNREKFVRNKKTYNKMLSKNKNYNYIIKRNFGTFHSYDFNNNNNNNNRLLYLILALTSYHTTKRIIEK